jgi:hypothetical protein
MPSNDRINKYSILFVLVVLLIFGILVGIWGRCFLQASGADQAVTQTRSTLLQFWGSLVMLAATILLVYITWLYVRANERLVDITKEQFDRTERVYVEFGLSETPLPPALWVWVANLGLCSFMISEIEYLRSETQPVTVRVDVVVPVSQKAEPIRVPASWSDRDKIFGVDVQIRVSITHLGQQTWTDPRGYHFRIQDQSPRDFLTGYHEERLYQCPNCGQSVYMRTVGIQNEEKFRLRKSEFLDALARGCPNHSSPHNASNGSGPA